MVGALEFYRKRNLDFYFVSNVDGTQIRETLNRLNPEKTLFIITSKTFITEETLANARTAKQWIVDHFNTEKAISVHFLAITGRFQLALDFGIIPGNILEIWDWVGGRFSISSAVGLPLMMAIGYSRFMEFLEGLHWMDLHFRTTSFRSNMPVILALLGIWYINFFSATSQAIIPYDHYLRDFPRYLQQLEMESNGKSVDRNGQSVTYETAIPVWGQPGTDGQHAFFQLFHQGTRLIPCDFIGFYQSLNDVADHHKRLTAHFFAQTEALAFGKTRAELVRERVPEKLIPYKICPGNKPTNTIMARRLTPGLLGKLIALYEHKVFVQGVIWNINSFDQWGVELGKQLAGRLFRELSDVKDRSLKADSSSEELIRYFRKKQNRVPKKD
jgi:glucose-6-phosphate isomerase